MSVDLLFGPNVAKCHELEKKKFHLAYLDPPFFTGRNFKTKAGAHAYSDQGEKVDYWAGIWGTLKAIKPLMHPSGSIVVHCDHHMNYRIRELLDSAFGAENFASEIIWRYRRWPSRTRNFQSVHDTLYRYTMSGLDAATWNQMYEPLAASTLKTFGTRKQKAVVKNGKRTKSVTTEKESPGVPMGDVWDIGIIAPIAKERTGYPTQKPEKLLERIILSMTDPEDWILDPYCGSGTTLAVADRLGRNAVGIDQSIEAIEIASKRLVGIKLNRWD